MYFLQLFLLLFDISFCRYDESIEWYFFSNNVFVGFEVFYSLNFFHLSRFKNQTSPPTAPLSAFGLPLFLVLEFIYL